VIPGKVFPYPADNPPRLVPIYSPNINEDSDQVITPLGYRFLGGVLIVGGTRLLLYGLVDQQNQERERGKQKRLEDKKRSRNLGEKRKALEKEVKREGKIRKSRANVIWPWSHITA